MSRAAKNLHYKLVNGYLKPIIPIEVHKGKNSQLVEVLVDSGADLCVLPAEFGEALGIDIKSTESTTIGGIVCI